MMNQSLPDNEALRRWLEEGGPTPEGLDPELKRIVEETGRYEPLQPALSVNEAWERFAASNIEKPARVRSLWQRYAAIAAVVLALFAAGWIISRPATPKAAEPIAHITAPAELKTVSLPDGSMATINAASELEWNDHRNLNLKGEAFFEVVEGSDFQRSHGTWQRACARYQLQRICAP
ncbi:MAG: hypothetical protein R3B47_12555 [Bacteroidia bacterium]